MVRYSMSLPSTGLEAPMSEVHVLSISTVAAIDQMIADLPQRDLLPRRDVVNMLLDIRNIIALTDEAEPATVSPTATEEQQ